jgi:thymidine kinase
MAKLYFRYGAMNSGKSTAMLQTAYNYEERGHSVLLAKPAVDTKGDLGILSRLGFNRPTDFVLEPHSDAYETFQGHRARIQRETGNDVSALLIDEVQFLSEEQVDDLLRIVLLENIPVIAYGIRTDFQTVAFPGSRRMLEIAHEIEELKTICRCGDKAIFNARIVDDSFVFEGTQMAIDDDHLSYESLCGACYLRHSRGSLNAGRRQWPVEFSFEPDADFS